MQTSNLPKLPSLVEEMKMLNDTYWKKYQELADLKQLLATKQQQLENECSHEWEKDWDNRDAHSRWQCKHCNKQR